MSFADDVKHAYIRPLSHAAQDSFKLLAVCIPLPSLLFVERPARPGNRPIFFSSGKIASQPMTTRFYCLQYSLNLPREEQRMLHNNHTCRALLLLEVLKKNRYIFPAAG